MILKQEEVEKRLNNPLNLMNQLKNNKKNQAMSLFIRPVIENKITAVENKIIPAVLNEPTANELVDNIDAKTKLALAHDEALGLLSDSIAMARTKLDNIDAEKLPSMINASSKVVESIRKERTERDKINKGQEIHHHFYMPEQRKIEEYEVIEVS